MNHKQMKLLCWIMGITMFLVIFIYDTKRVDMIGELEKKYWDMKAEIQEQKAADRMKEVEDRVEIIRAQLAPIEFGGKSR